MKLRHGVTILNNHRYLGIYFEYWTIPGIKYFDVRFIIWKYSFYLGVRI